MKKWRIRIGWMPQVLVFLGAVLAASSPVYSDQASINPPCSSLPGRLVLDHQLTGSGKEKVVLLHGLLASKRYWSNVLPELETRYQILALDLLGFGNSPKPKIEYTVDQHIDAIEATLSCVGWEREPLILVGHSMGAVLALNVAARRPGLVKGLVLINSPVIQSPEEFEKQIRSKESPLVASMALNKIWSRFLCRIHEIIPSLFVMIARLFEPGLPDFIYHDFVKHTWESFSGSMNNVLKNQNFNHLMNQLNGIPVLAIVSSQDSHSTVRDFEPWKLSSSFRLVTVSGEHNFMLKDPNAALGALESFISKLSTTDR